MDSIKKIVNPRDYTADKYVDESGEILEMIIRFATEKIEKELEIE